MSVRCEVCGKTFPSFRGLNGHRNAHGGPVQQRKLFALADHIEIEHEREVPGVQTYEQLKAMHDKMHAERNDWNHK